MDPTGTCADSDIFKMQKEMKTYPRVLAIAGSDSGGGAGIQADIKAISATGSYAATAITAVTVQNTLGVQAIHDVPADIVRAQIEAVLGDIGADAVKIGMLSSAHLVGTVAATLRENGIDNIVLDPVMVSTSGHKLLCDDAIELLSCDLAPLCRVITPNLPEAQLLLGEEIASQDDFPEAARRLSAKLSGPSRKLSVLLKAGHLDGDIVDDCLYDAEADTVVHLPSRRIDTPNTHGTGCTLSSAFASFLAQGFGLADAAARAAHYIAGAIASGAEYSIGHGHGPVDHFWAMRKDRNV